jgi:rhamnogalacturonyl hydrolase YesR
VFSIGTTSVSIGTYQNLANKASFVNLVPNAGGQIMVNIKNNSAYSYLNGFVLYEINNPAATALSQIYGDAEKQTEVMLTEIAKVQATNPALVSPFTMENDNLKMVPSSNWTSGFFPGMLWNLYEYTGKAVWADRARSFTSKIEKEQYDKSSHDVGFKIYNSFGPGYRLTKDPAYRDVIIQSAKSLATRFNSKVGCIRSWDWNTRVWQYPVIIDNMMNLELLFAATRLSGDSSFYKIAVSHANATLKNHYRPDYSSYHVVDYDTLTGAVRKRMTFQGYSDASAWSRGQAWGLYGFAMCYRETKNKAYLEMAEKIADYLLNHLKMPADKIPYWDFDAPGIPNEPRDASAAAVTASALYELMKFSSTQAQRYRVAADNMVKSLTEQYRSSVAENKGFILLHSTGSKPSNSDVDKPLIYADYYYLEALLRSRDTVPGGDSANGFPVANAGSDQTITLPASTVTLNGSGTDADGTITAYKWEKFSGPLQFTLANATTQALRASNLVQGTYVFRLTVTDNAGAIANDDVVVVVNPAASTTTRYINVNLFGGSNPYNHAEWNNWNVNSSLNSGTFKYANATLSGISAALTKNTLADNGSSYGGTMAPPEVLRYTSYATSERTLTFSGLLPDKTYNLELYASRAKTGNSTVFSVGTTSVTVLTDNNKTVKASFTNLKANSSGQLLVGIKNLNTYNYLNGFILTETSNTTTTTTQAKAVDVITETAPAFKVEAFPNPASQYFTLKVQSGSNTPVQVHVVDAVGRVVEVRKGLASNITFLVGARFRPGIYYVEAVQNGKKVTIKLVKSAW